MAWQGNSNTLNSITINQHTASDLDDAMSDDGKFNGRGQDDSTVVKGRRRREAHGIIVFIVVNGVSSFSKKIYVRRSMVVRRTRAQGLARPRLESL
jgi:hypothetical protein